MWKFYTLIISVLLALCTLQSCNSKKSKKQLSLEEIKRIEQQLVTVNKGVVIALQDTIRQYVQKQSWDDMHTSESGLWYKIFPHAQDSPTDSIRKGDFVEFSYNIALLNGKECYSSATQKKNKIIKVGEGGIESGVEEIMLRLCIGDSARLLIPPHLAHGLIGDQECIPRLAVLLYTLKVEKKYIRRE